MRSPDKSETTLPTSSIMCGSEPIMMLEEVRNFFHTTSAMTQTGKISLQRLKDPKEILKLSETLQTEDSSALTGLMMNQLRSMAIIRGLTNDMLKLVSFLVTISMQSLERRGILLAKNASPT